MFLLGMAILLIDLSAFGFDTRLHHKLVPETESHVSLTLLDLSGSNHDSSLDAGTFGPVNPIVNGDATNTLVESNLSKSSANAPTLVLPIAIANNKLKFPTLCRENAIDASFSAQATTLIRQACDRNDIAAAVDQHYTFLQFVPEAEAARIRQDPAVANFRAKLVQRQLCPKV